MYMTLKSISGNDNGNKNSPWILFINITYENILKILTDHILIFPVWLKKLEIYALNNWKFTNCGSFYICVTIKMASINSDIIDKM